MSISASLPVVDSGEIPFDVFASASLPNTLAPWSTLAVSAVRQALCDAAEGNYDALLWLVDEGRAWLAAAGLPIEVVDSWVAKL